MVVSPVVVLVVAEALSPPLPSVSGQRGYGVWILVLLMLMVATFVSPPPGSNFHVSATDYLSIRVSVDST